MGGVPTRAAWPREAMHESRGSSPTRDGGGCPGPRHCARGSPHQRDWVIKIVDPRTSSASTRRFPHRMPAERENHNGAGPADRISNETGVGEPPVGHTVPGRGIGTEILTVYTTEAIWPMPRGLGRLPTSSWCRRAWSSRSGLLTHRRGRRHRARRVVDHRARDAPNQQVFCGGEPARANHEEVGVWSSSSARS